MKRTLFFMIGFCLAVARPADAQKNVSRYQEVVYLQVNTTFLLVGESLLFSVHCLNAADNKPSDLSKVVNVELVDENAVPVLGARIPMTDGHGSGDFFLPSTLSSGNYTLIAYTNWMRNFPKENFFQTQLTIINPFKKPTPSSTTGAGVSRSVNNIAVPHDVSSNYSFSLEKKSFKTREKVLMTLALKDTVVANLSVRVRKLDRLVTASDSVVRKPAEMSGAFESRFLPEVRGNLLTGVVTKNKKTTPAAGEKVYLTIPGKDFTFLISLADSSGRFYFNSNRIKYNAEAIVSVDSISCPNCEIRLDAQGIEEYSFFKPKPLAIDTSLRKEIEQRSIISQIENAYYTQKQDSLIDRPSRDRFYGKPDFVYVLDDFVRFPTMTDIFIEYISEIVISSKGGKPDIKVKSLRGRQTYEKNPLILIDGIPIFDFEKVMKFNPLMVEKIEIVGRRYFLGPLETQGIIAICTYEGSGKNIAFLKRDKYKGVQPRKKYFSPNYADPSSFERIPDYRLQLYWNPSVIVTGQPQSIAFFTSDLSGDFEIITEGIRSDGHLIYHREVIHVDQ